MDRNFCILSYTWTAIFTVFAAPFAFPAVLGYYVRMLSKTVKDKVIREYQAHKSDTGSAAVQVAVLSRQMDELARHLKSNPKDNHSRRGLLKMVSQRRRLLRYLNEKEPAAYEKTVKKLGLKK